MDIGEIIGIAVAGTALLLVLHTKFVDSRRRRQNLVFDIASYALAGVSSDTAAYLLITLGVSNRSEIPDSLGECVLQIGEPYDLEISPAIQYETEDGEAVFATRIPSTVDQEPLALEGLTVEPMEFPLNLAPRTTHIGTLAFPLPSIPRTEVRLLPMELQIQTVGGLIYPVPVDPLHPEWEWEADDEAKAPPDSHPTSGNP